MVLAPPLLSQLHRVASGGEPPFLRAFVSAAFADLLRTCPGLAARLFGDLGSLSSAVAAVQTDVPVAETSLDIVIEGLDGSRLLIENRLAPDVDWYEERSEPKPPSHVDAYVAASRHRYEGRARVLVLSRTEADPPRRRRGGDIFVGTKAWSSLYAQLQTALEEADETSAHRIRQFLDFLKEHDMNPCEPILAKDAETILAFDRFARNNLKLLEEAVGRIRQEFHLRATPNNRRLTGWYACSDRFQAEDLHVFFYLMFPPVPDLIVRACVQVTKESSHRAMTVAAEHGFRRGRWGSLWMERDYRSQHPFLALPAERQVEELVRFFQTPLTRLTKAGLVKVATALHEETPQRTASPGRAEKRPPAAAQESSASVTTAPSSPAPDAETTAPPPPGTSPEENRRAEEPDRKTEEPDRKPVELARKLAGKDSGPGPVSTPSGDASVEDGPDGAPATHAGEARSHGVEPASSVPLSPSPAPSADAAHGDGGPEAPPESRAQGKRKSSEASPSEEPRPDLQE